MTEILFKEESYAIVGACFNVYKDKGCGFLEPVYQECCEIEFAFQAIPFLSQSELELTYRGQILRQRYKPDFICFQKIIVELKASSALADEHRAQLLNYLHSTQMRLGLLVNYTIQIWSTNGLSYELLKIMKKKKGFDVATSRPDLSRA